MLRWRSAHIEMIIIMIIMDSLIVRFYKRIWMILSCKYQLQEVLMQLRLLSKFLLSGRVLNVRVSKTCLLFLST